jgi:hypothetical protein
MRVIRKGADMATKKKGAAQSSQVRAAWQRVQKALKQSEAAMRAVVEANAGLLRALSKAGMSMTQNARGELDARIKQLDSRRKKATKQLNDLAQRLMKRGQSATKRARRR